MKVIKSYRVRNKTRKQKNPKMQKKRKNPQGKRYIYKVHAIFDTTETQGRTQGGEGIKAWKCLIFLGYC